MARVVQNRAGTAQNMDAKALAEFISLLVDHPDQRITTSELARQAGIARTTINTWKEGTGKQGPHSSTCEAVEDACEMPRGTIAKVTAGELAPTEAAALFGTAAAPSRPNESVKYRLGNLESDVADLRRQLEAALRDLEFVARDRGTG